jgi:uncharacterized caspase-like protein
LELSTNVAEGSFDRSNVWALPAASTPQKEHGGAPVTVALAALLMSAAQTTSGMVTVLTFLQNIAQVAEAVPSLSYKARHSNTPSHAHYQD